MSDTSIELLKFAKGRMIGMRSSAEPIKAIIADALDRGDQVILNFTGVEVTQAFVDELIGFAVRQNGANVVDRLVFKRCSETTKSILSTTATSG